MTIHKELCNIDACLCFSGPVVMNMSGYSEKGFKRKLAVQALFGKVFYLSEVSNQTVCVVCMRLRPCMLMQRVRQRQRQERVMQRRGRDERES